MKENIINEDNESAPRNSVLSLNLNEVSQCVMKGKTAKDRNNIELQVSPSYGERPFLCHTTATHANC